MKTKTGATTQAIIRYLRMIGFWAWENQTVGIWDPGKKIYRKKNSLVKGAPDILAVDWDDRSIMVEIKTGRDRLSADQTIFMCEVLIRNGIYIIAANTQDVIDGLIYYGYKIRKDTGYLIGMEIEDFEINHAYQREHSLPNLNKVPSLKIIDAARIGALYTPFDKTEILKHHFKTFYERLHK